MRDHVDTYVAHLEFQTDDGPWVTQLVMLDVPREGLREDTTEKGRKLLEDQLRGDGFKFRILTVSFVTSRILH